MSYPAIRSAVVAEIDRLNRELSRLRGMLEGLDDAGGATGGPPRGGRRGRPGRPRKSHAVPDPAAVLELIKAAGKPGIKAISLAHRLRKQNLTPVPKAQLVEAGVRVTGTRGGTTYAFAG